jgi:hypothetical protein
MSRVLTAGVALVLVVPVGSAPKLKDVVVGPYYPTTVGDRWVTETRTPTEDGESTQTLAEVVTAVDKTDGARVVSIAQEVDGATTAGLSRMKVTDDGLFRAASYGTVYDAPYCVLKLPLKAGATWTSEAKMEGTTRSTFKYRVGADEDVEVPAGKFKAVRIEVEIDTQGRPGRSTIWYAPRVGVVKQIHESGARKYTKVLKSFTPAK